MELTFNQKMKFSLLTSTGNVEKAKEAFDFVMEYKENFCRECEKKADDNPEVVDGNEKADKVMLVYADEHAEEFTGSNPKKNIAKIGVIFQGHRFAIALRDLPKQYSLVSDSDKCEAESPLYKGEIDSIFDWDVESHTKHIVEVGTDIPLNEGEFIPTAAMLAAMYRMREKLNEALVFAGGDPFKTDDYYWSCSENSQHGSWMLYFGSGDLGNDYKYDSYCVRPCTAFNL